MDLLQVEQTGRNPTRYDGRTGRNRKKTDLFLEESQHGQTGRQESLVNEGKVGILWWALPRYVTAELVKEVYKEMGNGGGKSVGPKTPG